MVEDQPQKIETNENCLFPDSPEIQYSLKKITERANALFSVGIDFVKWTTTLSIAAIVWIATPFAQANNPIKLFSAMAILFFILSIIMAIFIVYFVLSYWTEHLKSSHNWFHFLIAKDEKYQKLAGYTGSNMVYYRIAHNESEAKLFNFRNPEKFSNLVVIHMVFLLLGLLSFLVSLIY
ncbi:MAG: hypothetical protein LUQ31_01925 [Methanoregula sp.]|nr:hypothetical protein [Methanoregula sp.]